MLRLQTHWWWRPGWRRGRHFYACHLTLDHASGLHDLVDRYQGVLRPFPGLDLIPAAGCISTMHGIGFTDEVTDAEQDSIGAAIAMRLTRTRRRSSPSTSRWSAREPATFRRNQPNRKPR